MAYTHHGQEFLVERKGRGGGGMLGFVTDGGGGCLLEGSYVLAGIGGKDG